MGLWRGKLPCLALAVVAISAVASPARGAEITRDQYVERAEAICKPGALRAKSIVRKGFREFKANEVRIAGPKFTRASRIYEQTRPRLRALPKPAADAEDLDAWLKQLKVQNYFLGQTGKALSEAHRVRAQGFLSRFIHNGNLANDLVLGFGFDYCLFDKKIE